MRRKGIVQAAGLAPRAAVLVVVIVGVLLLGGVTASADVPIADPPESPQELLRYCFAPGLAIPDGPGGMAVSTGEIYPDYQTEGQYINDLNVEVDITHTWVGDLSGTLDSANGQNTATLLDRPGVLANPPFGCSGVDVDITLDDEAAAAVDTSCMNATTPAYPAGGSYQPTTPLSAFDGQLVVGTYTLTMTDDVVAFTGTLNEWCLVIDSETHAIVEVQGNPPPDALANWNGNPTSPTYDGRLNPHPAEYYSAYCANNQVQLYKAEVGLINSVPISYVLGMNVNGATLNIGQGMTLARNGDSVTVAGSNGNYAPQPGSKEFRLSECLARNGSTPPAIVPPGQQTLASASGSTTTTSSGQGQTLQTLPAFETRDPGASCTHVVQSGQTAFRIAINNGTTLSALQAANPGVNLTRLAIGQPLILPSCAGGAVVNAAPPQTQTVPPVTETVGQAQAPVAAAPAQDSAAPAGARTHTVQAGENLFRIALRYGVSLDALIAVNHITDVQRVPVGQVLVIP